jgi:hypothetical protein
MENIYKVVGVKMRKHQTKKILSKSSQKSKISDDAHRHMSMTAQKKQDQKINMMLQRKMDEKHLEKERKLEDIKDKLTKNNMTVSDINEFNTQSLIDALKESGMDTTSSTFADMERMIQNNESIRELVDTKNIRMKTFVTVEQRNIITILFGSYATLLNRYGIRFQGLERILNEFMELSPSIDGKRTEQFVTAHQALAQAVANANKGHDNTIRDNEMKT